MALGFGFNKAKVLASAEKAVQQGKLQNAIADYMKVLKEDPKDLTVLNTVGDLHARVGNNDEAAKCFQKVGEQYASDGFTVKAIAMYKKLTKLSGNVESLQRLAELYTVQGLYNDARQQYVQVADAHLKNQNHDDAAKVFQKILELDPDNTAMQQKLADLYIKLGKKTEAVNIYLTAAQNLYIKQAMDTAEEACAKVLSIEKDNLEAKILRGTIAAESGDGQTAYECLNSIPNLDSRPDALRSLLRAQIAMKKLDEAGPLVSKLVTVHNDLNGIFWYAEALLNEGQLAEGVAVYEQYAEKVLAAQGQTLIKNLSAIVTRAKNSSKALLSLKSLFMKAGDTTHEGEITELLAHAYVEEGELQKAKELYKHLADSEPENPLHAQNFKQVVAKLGEDATAQITAEQGSQALMAEQLESTAPAIRQEYSIDVSAAIQQALTDAELYESYNLPAKCIAPLETGLRVAPKDVRINQRLAAAYLKAGRFADVAQRYSTLREIFDGAGHKVEAAQYAEMASKYAAMTSSATAEAEIAAPSAYDSSTNPAKFAEASVQQPVADAGTETPLELVAPAEMSVAEIPVSEPAEAGAHEIAIDEWESMLSVEAPATGPVEAPNAFEVSAPTAETPVESPAISAETESEAFERESGSSSDGAAVAEISFESTVAPVEKRAAPAPEISIEVPTPEPTVAPESVVERPKPTPPAPKPVPVAADDDDILGDLVSELEESLGDNFFPAEKPAPAFPAKTVAPPPPPSAPAPAMPAAASAAAPAPARSAPAPDEAVSALSDIFSEFKEDAEATAGEAEDPETHYNLGIAFKEMGLLDEAIGELQKVAKAIDQGAPFPQRIQAYTWLAQCLVDKGVPQAAVRWFERALRVDDMDDESKLAVYYDLGNAHEMAGNRQKAHDTFLEVYSLNIDYRDVADRIKALKN